MAGGGGVLAGCVFFVDTSMGLEGEGHSMSQALGSEDDSLHQHRILLREHGARVVDNFNASCTHVLTNRAGENSDVDNMMMSTSDFCPAKVVSPAWAQACIRCRPSAGASK